MPSSPRSRLVLRRYLPLGGVVAIQLLLVGLLPSTAGSSSSATAGSDAPYVSPYAAGGSGSGAAGGAGGTSGPGAQATNGAAGGGTAAGGGGGGGTGGGGGNSSGVGTAALKQGDTTHCVGGRQFDPAIDYYAPPCVPAVGRNSSGATYPGVTGTTIELVNYYPQGNAAVDTATKAQGLYVSIDQQRQWDAAATDFINQHFELYGRKVKIDTVQGTCSTIPPDESCLRNEMHTIQAKYHPFMFRWISPLSSAPFDELSAMHVINVGGLMFTDGFSQARRPYHWDVHESGTQLVTAFGKFYCNQLKAYPAAYSSSPTAATSVNGQARVLGVIGTDDPENILMRQQLDTVLHGCGASVAHHYDAHNDVSTAAAQKSAAVAQMRQSPAATTVLCLCNPVGAMYIYQEEQQDNYYPENVFAGTVYSDDDDSGQSFMNSQTCPSGTGCEFSTAFGLSTTDPQDPAGRNVGNRIWAATGHSGAVPFPGVDLDWSYYSMMATLIQGAGPNLTPGNLEQGAFQTPARGGGSTGHALRGFSPGSYAWNHDTVLAYWDPKRTSAVNGKTGTYVRVGGRVAAGSQYPVGKVNVPTSR